MNEGEQSSSVRMEYLMTAYNYSMQNKKWTQAQKLASLMNIEAGYGAETAYYLADAFYMSGKLERAIDCLAPFFNSPTDGSIAVSDRSSSLTPEAVYLYALCCFGKERYSDVVAALYPRPRNSGSRPDSMFKLDRIDSVVHGAAGLELLGNALERLGDRSGALECYTRCVDLNPMMFEAYERLSSLSFDNRKTIIPPQRFAKAHLSDDAFTKSGIKPATAPTNPPSIMTSTPVKQRPSSSRRALSPPSISKPPLHPSMKPTPLHSVNSGSSVGQIVQTMAAAVHALNGFDANVVVDIISRLPVAYQESGWIQSMIGKAMLDAGRFEEAEASFGKALRADPFGAADEYIDLYSSVLWQLRKEKELAHLCRHGINTANRATCPKLWVAVGNSFSLQKESEHAIRFLNRAVQIDPNYAYAHVLIGHEMFGQDKFDKAKQCYNRALEIDPRNFNAYWGLGQVYAKQEELVNAKYQFIKALEINPKSSTVRYSLASVAMGLRENDLAYQQLSLAYELNPRNIPALCQKGMIEMTVFRKLDVAKDTLEKAQALQPAEPVIYVLLGKIYAAEGQREKAMKCYNEALEILRGAKDNYGIKQCIEELDFFASPTDTQ
jgi:tetratricopeptide (TPR) repeat protein